MRSPIPTVGREAVQVMTLDPLLRESGEVAPLIDPDRPS